MCIRDRSRPIWYLVPDGVVQYVSKRNLYPASAATGDNTQEKPS